MHTIHCRSGNWGRRFASLVLFPALIILAAGCAVVESSREATRQMMSMFKPRPAGYRGGSEEAPDAWVDEFGTQARGLRPREKDPDGWWGKYIISEQHRSIERNLGVDYE